ncbi:MAG: secretion protein HlyD [Verrucomicrobia bacterium]|nr:secretion protein HlyD [Verrucomicrobiota bacterium]
MKRRLLILALVLAAAAGAWLAYRQFEMHRPKGLQVYGNVDIRQVNLGFRVSGRVAEMRVDEGDTVKAGDIIARLDAGPYQDQVDVARAQFTQAQANYTKMVAGFRKEEIDQARAQVEQMRANLTNADVNYKRQRALQQTHVIAQQDLDNATAQRDAFQAQLHSAEANLALELVGNRPEDIDMARAQMDNAKAGLQNAVRNLSDCRLVAPSDGVVITRAVEPGTIVSVGATVYSLALNEPIWIRSYIDEPDLGRIYPGMKALVYTDANPGKPYEGRIGFISPVAEFTPKEVQTRQLRTALVFRFRVVIQNPGRYLRQGMPVTVKLVQEPHPDVPPAMSK